MIDGCNWHPYTHFTYNFLFETLSASYKWKKKSHHNDMWHISCWNLRSLNWVLRKESVGRRKTIWVKKKIKLVRKLNWNNGWMDAKKKKEWNGKKIFHCCCCCCKLIVWDWWLPGRHAARHIGTSPMLIMIIYNFHSRARSPASTLAYEQVH